MLNIGLESLKKRKEGGGTKRGAMDPSFAQKRKAKVAHWIRPLRMTYPYRVNDIADDETTTNRLTNRNKIDK